MQPHLSIPALVAALTLASISDAVAGGDDLAGRLIGLAMARPYDGAARTPFCER